MNSRKILSGTVTLICSALIFAACGKVQDKVTEVKNDQRIKGSWLLVSTENNGTVLNSLEKESLVLTFKDEKTAFSAVSDSPKAKALLTALNNCTAGPRPYKIDKDQIVLSDIVNCPQKQAPILTLDDTTLKFADPNAPQTVRVFRKLSDDEYQTRVKPADRRL
jgi:hypothetical protein